MGMIMFCILQFTYSAYLLSYSAYLIAYSAGVAQHYGVYLGGNSLVMDAMHRSTVTVFI